MKLEEFKVYQMSMAIGEKVWDIVVNELETIDVKLNNYINSIGKSTLTNK